MTPAQHIQLVLKEFQKLAAETDYQMELMMCFTAAGAALRQMAAIYHRNGQITDEEMAGLLAQADASDFVETTIH